jgi:hypothetical protein
MFMLGLTRYRGVIALSCGLLLASGITMPALAETPGGLPQNLYFDVQMNGDDMGYHHLEYSRDGDDLVVDIDIDLRVKFAFITVFKYIHENEERWRDGRLVGVTSTTNDDGADYFVNASFNNGSLAVDGSRGVSDVTEAIASTTYWNYDSMVSNARMLNTQKGDVLDYTLEKLGEEEIMVRGKPVMADKYFLDSTIDSYLWYTQDTREWAGLEFDARGRTISYTLVADPSISNPEKQRGEGS